MTSFELPAEHQLVQFVAALVDFGSDEGTGCTQHHLRHGDSVKSQPIGTRRALERGSHVALSPFVTSTLPGLLPAPSGVPSLDSLEHKSRPGSAAATTSRAWSRRMAGLNPHAAIFEPTVTAGGGGGVYAPSMAGGAVKTRAAYGSVLIENIKEGGVYQPHRGRCHLCDAEFNSLRQEQDHISGKAHDCLSKLDEVCTLVESTPWQEGSCFNCNQTDHKQLKCPYICRANAVGQYECVHGSQCRQQHFDWQALNPRAAQLASQRAAEGGFGGRHKRKGEFVPGRFNKRRNAARARAAAVAAATAAAFGRDAYAQPTGYGGYWSLRPEMTPLQQHQQQAVWGPVQAAPPGWARQQAMLQSMHQLQGPLPQPRVVMSSG